MRICPKCKDKDSELQMVIERITTTIYDIGCNMELNQYDIEEVNEKIYFKCPECGSKFKFKGDGKDFTLNLEFKPTLVQSRYSSNPRINSNIPFKCTIKGFDSLRILDEMK